MKRYLITMGLVLAVLTTFAQKKPGNPATAKPKKLTAPVHVNTTALKTNLDSASYGFGLMMATNLKSNGLNAVNYDLIVRGLKDAFNGQPALLTPESSQAAITNLFISTSKVKYAEAIAEGEAFFANNKKVPGVITTASGLQYQVLKAGTGAKPTATSSVTVHYKGTLLNGKQFDSSYDRGEPATFVVNNVIPGWTEGLQLMQKGAKVKFFIPFSLAYGERAAGPEIPAYSNLIFEIELLQIDGK
jgi:FKBP-type peptidyl-prolyl cis-trans isomerase